MKSRVSTLRILSSTRGTRARCARAQHTVEARTGRVPHVELSAIDSLASGGDSSIDSAKSRALWFSGIGIAGPGVIGGSLQLLNEIALALFVGFGPLFVLCLLFEKTRALFEKWLLYGIGTVFSLAVLSFMVSLANSQQTRRAGLHKEQRVVEHE